MKLVDIKTEVGNKILEDLMAAGWKKTHEYSPVAFDKGIDFDSYVLKKGRSKLKFKWNNWFQWEITGTEDELQTIQKEYALWSSFLKSFFAY